MALLIINADDYGLCDSVNRGIIECLEAGAVSDLSFLVNAPAFNISDKRLKSIKKTDIGFHLNFTTGPSILGVQTKLVNHNGNYHDLKTLTLKILGNHIPVRDIYREIKSQIELLINCQYRITHIDSHRNIHLLPPIMKVLLQIRRELGLNAPIRMPYERINNVFELKALNMVRISMLNAMTLYCYLRTRYRWNVKTIGGNFFNNPRPALVLHEIKNRMKKKPHKVFEMAVHPGYPSRQLMEYDDYYEQRLTEMNILIKECFCNNSDTVQICSFADLPSQPSG